MEGDEEVTLRGLLDAIDLETLDRGGRLVVLVHRVGVTTDERDRGLVREDAGDELEVLPGTADTIGRAFDVDADLAKTGLALLTGTNVEVKQLLKPFCQDFLARVLCPQLIPDPHWAKKA